MLELGFQIWLVITLCVWSTYFKWILNSTQINGIITVPPEVIATIPQLSLKLALIWPLTLRTMIDMYGE